VTESNRERPLKVAVIGFGIVGAGIIERLVNGSMPQLVLSKVVVKDPKKARAIKLSPGTLTASVEEVLKDPEIDIVIEVIGGLEPATDIILRALRSGKHVITANKMAIAEKGGLIFPEALKRKLSIGFRGTFVGCSPLIHDLSARLKEGKIRRISAILNGTSNYILSEMSERNSEFQTVLKEAQDKGYAEKDPSQDIDGIDTAYKLHIILGLTYNTYNIYNLRKVVPVEGIRAVTLQDIQYAGELGFHIRLLGVIEAINSKVYARVFPALVKDDSLLGSTKGANNAIEVEDEWGVISGLIAPGAGKEPTATALSKDLIDIARGSGTLMPEGEQEIKLGDPLELNSRFYLRFTVTDKPGVLAQIAKVFWDYNISIAAVIQKPSELAEQVPLVMLLHPSKEKNVFEAIRSIDKLPFIIRETRVIRIYDVKSM